MSLQSLIRKVRISHLLKACLFLIILLLACGAIIGLSNIRQARSESDEINSICNNISSNGITEPVKSQISAYVKKYNNTTNVILTDTNSKIIYSANKNLVKDMPSFDLENSKQWPGLAKLKGTNIYFNTNPKQFNLRIPLRNRDYIVKEGALGRHNMFVIQKRPQGPLDNTIRPNMDNSQMPIIKNVQFLKQVHIADKNINVYFISNGFRESNSLKVFFITNMLLRIVTLVLWILCGAWVYKDSKSRGLHYLLWGIFAIVFGPFGLLAYLFYKSMKLFCTDCKKIVGSNDNYCSNCGCSLKSECRSCKSILSKKSNYCSNCGVKQETSD